MSSSTLHRGLPEDVISQILASFCDGKSISTFFHVLWGNCALRQNSSECIRSTLVHRYRIIAASDGLEPNRREEMRDVCAFVREDIRLAKLDHETERGLQGNGGDDQITESSKAISTLVSEWCAIVDYFTLSLGLNEHVVWVGDIHTQFGPLRRVCIRSPFWTVTSLQYFYSQIELLCESLLPPIPIPDYRHLLGHPYGHLAALDVDVPSTNSSTQVMQRLRDSLSVDEGSHRFSIVPSHLEYEEEIPFLFAPTSNDIASRSMLLYERHLLCLWDRQDECDFDESLTLFGENAIRILERLEKVRKDALGVDRKDISWQELVGSDLAPFDDESLM